MTDHPETSSRYRLPWRRDQMKQMAGSRALRNPALLIGAAVLGVVGVIAWRNREKIAQKTAPLIEDAKLKGQALIEDAKVKGQELIDEAKAKTEEVAQKARVRRRATPETLPPELH
jgi:hypothetical protein